MAFQTTSFVLAALHGTPHEHLLPNKPLACANCPAAMWTFDSGNTVQCYCKILHFPSWESGKTIAAITICDTPDQAAQATAAKAAVALERKCIAEQKTLAKEQKQKEKLAAKLASRADKLKLVV